ncbi:MAG: hypothetical protein E5W43_18575 [Mesorhizobium sp.]|uniref:hypothetical protein n=2 Tax=unclassified Mesorhizobium TaxID=325217 RepID=UPI000FCB2E50|nr:hypothetical protein [Mesorhizobium sp. M1A.F.Ca.IN.022.04.1.1]TGQ15785.1 hypothetical protein EN860_024800 [Mesorhizobium sp. M00.F.Ca.ET.217.01.1.1]TGV87022.1 hypothetical protein EN801_025850 [Mesorhizobium sp. M00.F.Ca.ET.158.01.1.1]TIT97486.1 MAG: hypothetical protein E5W43_18575 [Mesorhizobium sp.]WIE89651.1 hypothetical protein P9270_019015 [Mesorhizobium sp. WSM4875]RUV14975.1 hypothetical protein EOA91_23420 [Mesorhizobium sp. M1A.F.Ca.IN.022.04.1.1]
MMRLAILVAVAAIAVLGVRAADAAGRPVTVVDDPQVLAKLDADGFGFAGIFGISGKDDLKTLYDAAPAYHAIVDTVAADVAALRADLKAGGRPLYEVTDGNVGRIIDMRWLKTDAARFRLVGVVNRLDRRDFAKLGGEAGCGEVRFIYRLAYSFRKNGKVLASRLPFNFSAIYRAAPDADGGCTGVAGRWTPQIDEAADAGWLSGGPLDKASLSFKQLELNAQVVRFPSGQETEFGGQAAYLMRIFGIDGTTISQKPLENTPDTIRLAQDARLKARLTDYVRANAGAIDLGVYEIPDEFLAKKVISWSTFGSARQANHPFTPLFEPEALAGVDYSKLTLARTAEALIERLDNGACHGCHQAGSTAGFHFIGLDDSTTSPLNRIEVGISPHLHAEIPRREAWLQATVEGREANGFRPLSFAPPAAWKDTGEIAYTPAETTMPCLVPEDAARFGSSWQCGAGTVCTQIATATGVRTKLAQCLLPKESRNIFSGHPCLTGTIASDTAQPFNDRYNVTGQFAAFAPAISRTAYTCRPPKIGVPGGFAYRGCDAKDLAFSAFKAGKPMPSEICGLVGGKKFDICVATNNFDQCLGGAVNRGNRPACSADRFCREDYMCQSLPSDTPGAGRVKGIGFCSPTYFLFQMRIDNHATPWTNTARASMSAGFGATEE